MNPSERFVGCLIGTALGDSLLLPAEGLTRAKIAKRFAGPLGTLEKPFERSNLERYGQPDANAVSGRILSR